MHYRIATLLILFNLLSLGKVCSQGCSDPGICTSGSLNAGNTQDSAASIDFTLASLDDLLNATVASEKYRLGTDVVYGRGDKGTAIYNLVIRASMRIQERVLINVKMPLAYIKGNIGNTSGTGDLTLTMQNTFKSGKSMNLAYTVGVIIPTNSANLMYVNRVMPMAYQSSLGLYSGLAGLSMRYKTWSAVLGYQQSFGSNENGFWEVPATDPNDENYELDKKRSQYYSSKNLTRSADLIVRLEKGFELKKMSIAIGTLPILRIGTSSIVDSTGAEVSVEGSDGLTLNFTAGASYNISNSTFVRLNFGAPILRRKVRPDGLSRTTVIILGFGMKFW
ncbi:MAG: hypothetical protein JKX73_01415 [Flavobacteriales bacterium]|nr:hypothetical protein [Flavobacteriales bacterium]